MLSNPMVLEGLITAGIIVGVIVVSFAAGLLWKHVFKRLAHKTPTKLDIMVFERTEKPIVMVLLVGGFYYAFWRLGTKTHSLVIDFSNKIFFVLAVLASSCLLYALVKAVTDWYMQEIASKTKTALDEQFAQILTKLARLVIFAIGIMIILDHFEVNITGLVATAGVASLALAFAAQDSLSNLFAGLTIMLDKPFRKGDRVELADGKLGDVVEIGLRSTKILTFDHTQIVVPNAEIAKSCVINYSYPNPKFKVRQTIGVAYGSDTKKVKNVLLGICRAHSKVMDDPEPQVFFMEFADSSLNFRLQFWIEDYRDKFEVLDGINMEIDRNFNEKNIEIPFPQRDVHLYNESRED